MFVERLRELIEERCNGSQKIFAEKCQIPTTTVNNWLKRGSSPTYLQIIKIADAFQISTDFLLGRENYGTGIVEIKGMQLDESEKKIINNYRSLSADGKKAFVEISDSLAKAHRK